MEIKNNMNRLDPCLNRLQAEKGEGRAAAEKAGAAASADTVQIQSPGLKATVEAAAMSAPDARENRVAAIKASLADGTYQIDNRAIAEKLLQEAGDLNY